MGVGLGVAVGVGVVVGVGVAVGLGVGVGDGVVVVFRKTVTAASNRLLTTMSGLPLPVRSPAVTKAG